MGTWFVLCVLLSFSIIVYSQGTTHIVYLGSTDESIHPDTITESHYHMLRSVIGSHEAAQESLIYSYRHGFDGFAADLPNVAAVFPSEIHTLHTTDSWDFLGLSGKKERSLFGVANESLWKDTNYGQDVIIGVVDSGIWPESASFADNLMGPIPTRWRGSCERGELFNSSNCNRKLIGARFFPGGFINKTSAKANRDLLSPRDVDGHGTLTSSTAGGNFVSNANWLGYANGTAKGGAPKSRIAMYKTCWRDAQYRVVCPSESILAAFDMGIHDGVDVFSISLGFRVTNYLDPIAISAFYAIQKGIVVVASAGNNGPADSTVLNVAPWIITVAASSIDRNFYTSLYLGSNAEFTGLVMNEHKLKQRWYSIVWGADAALKSSSSTLSQYCYYGSLDPKKVNNKIVACLLGPLTSRTEVERAGGVGMVLCKPPLLNILGFAVQQVIPIANISMVYISAEKDTTAIFSYIHSTKHPRAYISGNVTTLLKQKPAPIVATFSSKGPNPVTPNILKPDITAPGVNILAAYSEYEQKGIKHRLGSGTSLSCPHVSGVVALLKSYRPNWSPQAIKSAIVTTGFLTDNLGDPIKTTSLLPANPFHFGGGHINPNAAAHPGLIYDANGEDYIKFLCSLNYTSSVIRMFTKTCPKNARDASNLNYPSIAISDLRNTKTISRRVTNVDDDATTYRATVSAPYNVRLNVTPSVLHFNRKGETKSFEVTFKVKKYVDVYTFGYLTWTNGQYNVRSPIAIKVIR